MGEDYVWHQASDAYGGLSDVLSVAKQCSHRSLGMATKMVVAIIGEAPIFQQQLPDRNEACV